mgnify:FL=1
MVKVTWSSVIGALGSELVYVGEFTERRQVGTKASLHIGELTSVPFVYHYSICVTNICKSRVFLRLSRKNMQEVLLKKAGKAEKLFKCKCRPTLIGSKRPLHYH